MSKAFREGNKLVCIASSSSFFILLLLLLVVVVVVLFFYLLIILHQCTSSWMMLAILVNQYIYIVEFLGGGDGEGGRRVDGEVSEKNWLHDKYCKR